MKKIFVIFIFLIPFAGYSQVQDMNTDINTLGNFREFTFDKQSLIIIAENGKLEISRYSDDIIKISVGKTSKLSNDNYSVIKEPSGTFSLRHNWSIFELTTASLRIVINRYPVYITFYDKHGNLLHQDHPEMSYVFANDKTYGFKRNLKDDLYVSPFFEGKNSSEMLNHKEILPGNSGLYVTLNSGKCFGIFADNLNGSYFNFGSAYKDKNADPYTYFSTTGNELHYFFIYDKEPLAVIKKYYYLTGYPLFPPLIAISGPDDALTYKAVNTLTEFNMNSKLYTHGLENNYFIRDFTGLPFRMEIDSTYYVFPDYTNPLAASWWVNSSYLYLTFRDTLSIFYSMPRNIYSSLPDYTIADLHGNNETVYYLKNTWGFLLTKSIFAKVSKEIKRPLIYSNSCYPGIQRYLAYPMQNICKAKNDVNPHKTPEKSSCYSEFFKCNCDQEQKLTPYLYSLYRKLSFEGDAIIVPPCLVNFKNKKLNDQNADYRYIGPFLLQLKRSEKPIHLYEKGAFYFMHNDSLIKGGLHKIKAGHTGSNILVKSPAIITQRSVRENSDTLFIHIYNGKENCCFDYYEDDGISDNYKKGQYYSRKISFNPTNKIISMHPANGSYQSIYKKLSFIFHGFSLKKKIKVNSEKVTVKRRSEYFEVNTDNIVSEIVIEY